MQTEYNAVKKVLSAHPGVNLAYLFGSAATGESRPDRDLNLGISASCSNPASLKLLLLEELAAVEFEKVDITFFEQSPPLVCFEMVRHNRLLYCREGFSASGLFSHCLKEYFDIEPDLKVQREAYKRRLLYG